MKNVMLLCMLVFLLVACKKEEVIVDATEATSLQLSAEEELEKLIALHRDNQGSARFNLANATSAHQIPDDLYIFDIRYRAHYSHTKQEDEKCSATSYVNTANMVAKKNGKSYPGNGKTLSDHISNIYKNVCPSKLVNCIYWSVAKSNHEKTKVSSSLLPLVRSRRFDAIKHLLGQLNTSFYSGKPIIITVGIEESNWSYHGNDIHAHNSSSRKNWISSNCDNAHYITISAINWKKGGTGSVVYYYDPLSNNGNLQACSFTRLLDAMTSGCGTTQYNMLSIW